jgi:hypothetical protein
MRVDHDSPLLVESWTLTVTSVATDSKAWTFSVAGARTGADGEGKSDEPFRSRSGRVSISPESWFRGFGKEPVPEGYTIRWDVVPMFADVFQASAQAAKPGLERATTVVQGIPAGRHVLQLQLRVEDRKDSVPGARIPLQSIRVYRPPFHQAAT